MVTSFKSGIEYHVSVSVAESDFLRSNAAVLFYKKIAKRINDVSPVIAISHLCVVIALVSKSV